MYSTIIFYLFALYVILKIFLNKISQSAILLKDYLVKNDYYILSNNFCDSGEKPFFMGLTYTKICDLSCIERVVDIDNDSEIINFLKNISKNKILNLIIHTNETNKNNMDFLALILYKNNYKVNLYIPDKCLGSSSFLLIIAKQICLNWYTSISPIIEPNDQSIRTSLQDIGYSLKNMNINDDKFTDKLYYLKNITKKNNYQRLKKEFVFENKSTLKFDMTQLKKLGINCNNNFPENFEENFSLFRYLSNE